MARKTGTAPCAIRNHLIILIQESLLPDLFNNPPERLDVGRLIGNVRMIHVKPKANFLGKILPLGLILPYRFPALLVKFCDAIFLNFFFVFKTELVFHFNFDRQPMSIPPRLSLHPEPPHGFVAANYILEGTREHVVDSGPAVQGGRSFVKHKIFRFLAIFHALFKNLVLFPELQNVFFYLRKIHG